MVGFRFPFPNVSLCFKRVLGPITAALALLAFVPQAWSATPTFTVANTTFPSTVVGQSTSQNVTLTVNTAVPITSIALGANFTEYTLGAITGCTVDPTGSTIATVGTVCTIPVTFKPKVPGIAATPAPISRSAPLLVTDIESAKPNGYSFALTGSATGSVFAFAPGYLTALVGNASFADSGTTPGCPAQTDTNGDGCPATDALIYPTSMALDPAGNLYISDGPLEVVHKVDAVTGIISIYAGTYKQQGPSGSGGPATSAKFFNPGTIAVDQAGNVYLDDPVSGLWEINPASGIATIVAGGGAYSIAEAIAGGKPASQASFTYVSGMVVDASGNIYFGIYEGGAVYRIDAVTDLITVVAGDGTGTGTYPATGYPGPATSAKIGNPLALAMDSSGNLYIADANNGIVFRVDTTGNIAAVAGTQTPSSQYGDLCVNDAGDWGPATAAVVGFPSALAFDTANNLYIGEPGSQGGTSCPVRRVDAATGTIHVVAGDITGSYGFLNNVGATEAYLSPNLVSVDGAGDIYVGQQNISGGVVKILPSQSALIFPQQSQDVTGLQLVTASNIGIGTALTLSNYPFPIVPVPTTATPTPFSNQLLNGADPQDCSVASLPPGGVCGIQVAYNPTSNAAVVANETVEDNSLGVAGTTNVINITGSAYNGPTITLAPNPLIFPTLAVGTPSAAMSTNFYIIISPNVTYGTTTISGPDASSFSLSTGTNTCTSGMALSGEGGTCNIYVIFTPQTSGALNATLNVTYTAKGVTYDLSEPISGNGGSSAPSATLLPNPLDFGGQVESTTSAAQIVTLSNTGSAAITSIVPTLTGTNAADFAILTTGTNICGSSLAAGSTCNFYITFTPAATGSQSATLSVADSATGSPQTASLTGTGVLFQSNVGQPTAAAPVSIYFSTAGTLSSIQVLTQGTANLDFTVASGGTCATGTAYTIGQSCTVNVSFDPLYPGARNGSILLTDSSSNVLGTTYLPGTGNGPLMVFEPGVQSTLPAYSGGAYSAPLGVSVDAALNVYVADTLNGRIIKIPWTGTAYGTPINLPAIGLNQPSAVAVDGSGNLFIADTKNFQVVELPWNGVSYGTQITLDASALPDPDGIAVDANGNVYFADGIDQKLVEVPWTGTGYGAPVTITQATGLHSPHGVAVDATGNVFIADSDNNRVVELPWTPSGLGTEVELINGLFYPEAVAVDANGDVYIANSDAGSVIELPWNGISFGSQITIPFGILGNSNGLAVDARGNVYVADGGNSDVVKLDVFDPPTLSFASTKVGSTSTDSPKNVTVYNIGNTDLYFNALANNPVYPLDFPINSNASNLCEGDDSVDIGSSCVVSVKFTPTTSGSLSEDIVLTDNNLTGNTSTQSIQVKGSGTAVTAPAVTLNPTSLTFSVPSGSTSPVQTSTLTNTGTAPLTITATALTGTNASSFSEQDNCVTSSPIAINGTCTISVHFAPTSTASFTAAVSITDNASNSPQSLTLNGTGTAAGAPIASLTPSVLAFPATPAGLGNQLQASLHNTGNASLNNITMTITGANAYMFQIYPNGSCYGQTTLGEDSSCTITVQFNPPGPGSFEAVLTVTDNATGSPQTSILTGEGTQAELQFSPGQFGYIAGTPGMLGDTGSGPAASALIGGGYGIAIDSTGRAYFSDYTFNTVWQIDSSGNINSYAGTPVEAPGHGTYSGDNGPAASATLDAPEQIAFDPSGNLYIADRFNNLIRMVNSSGIITTFAGSYGNGFGGYAGDGGPANQATLSSPQGVTSDPQGNIYIADTSNFVIRKVDTTGTITLFAGTPGVNGYSGDNGPALSAKLGQCYQLATDLSGNLYIADFSNGVVRKVDSSGTITTYAGGGTAAVTATPQSATSVNLNNGPVGLATDLGGNLYVLGLGQTNSPGVFVVNASQQISQIVGGGAALVNGAPANAEASDLNAIAVDNSGNLYVDDAFENLVAEIGPNGDLLFPNTPVNTVSAPLTVTLTNTGNAPLGFFNQNDSGVVPAKLHSSAKRPTASVREPHSNVIGFNSYGSIAGPFAVASGGTCNFNEGIQPGASCTMNVTFNPTVAGAATGSIDLYTSTGDGGDTTNAILLAGNGTGASTPAATLTPNLTFPNTNVATTSAALAATLSNTGSGALTIGNIAIGGTNASDFAIATGTNACGTSLAAAATCSIYVTFTPASAASFSGPLTVTDNASPTTQSITLTGTGTTAAAPIATLTSTLAFPSTLAGSQSAAMSATLSNSGNATLNISSIALAGTNPADFTISTGSNACGATLAADASCSISVVFNPASAASFTAALNVADNAAGSPQSTSLTGTGTAPPDFTISATPATQSIAAGAAATYTVTGTQVNGSFEPNITLTASGLPPGATASFAPAQISVSDGSGASILTVQTAGVQTAQSRSSIWPFATPALALLLLVPFRRWRRVWRGKLMLLVIGLVSMTAAITLSACGGGFALTNQTKTYTITVTGTGGTDTHTTTVQLTVK